MININNNLYQNQQKKIGFGMNLSKAQEMIYPSIAKEIKPIYPQDALVSIDHFCKKISSGKFDQGVILGYGENTNVLSIKLDKPLSTEELLKTEDANRKSFTRVIVDEFKSLSSKIDKNDNSFSDDMGTTAEQWYTLITKGKGGNR